MGHKWQRFYWRVVFSLVKKPSVKWNFLLQIEWVTSESRFIGGWFFNLDKNHVNKTFFKGGFYFRIEWVTSDTVLLGDGFLLV